jgi:hypothetical protein
MTTCVRGTNVMQAISDQVVHCYPPGPQKRQASGRCRTQTAGWMGAGMRVWQPLPKWRVELMLLGRRTMVQPLRLQGLQCRWVKPQDQTHMMMGDDKDVHGLTTEIHKARH